jgi:hypothetical protein
VAAQQEGVKTYNIVVNGRQQTIAGLTGPNVLISVTYRRGIGDKPEGTLSPGQSVRLKDGMIFDVVVTDKS